MATAVNPRTRISRERFFYTGMAIAMLISVFIGFAPSYFLRPIMGTPPGIQPMTPLVHAHGIVFTAWILLFLAQTSLIASGRRDLHRKLGVFGFLLAIALIVLGMLAALNGVARASGPPVVPPLSWLAIPLISVFAFGPLFLAGIWKRNVPQVHKRLMVLGMVVMLSAAFGRMMFLPGLWGILVVPDLFIVALLIWDVKSRGRPHPVTVWGGLFVAASQFVPVLIWQSAPWLAFARWASGLVG